MFHVKQLVFMRYIGKNYDVIVVGAGHAGIEAALASARLGCKTACFTINLDAVGNLPCNPSIGGTSKGHLVREIDTLGGEMGKAADKTTIQSRMLNLGKGPAVHSLRAQIDRRGYQNYMKHALERQENLELKQCEITHIEKTDDGFNIITKYEAVHFAKAVIIATGTYLKGKIFIGDVSFSSGPDGMFPADILSNSLEELKIPMRRFKTGTPARINRRSVDFSALEVQPGDEKVVPFSYETDYMPKNDALCYITFTNDETKEIVLRNIERSALYGGEIVGTGPRYCPSLEDKFVRFPEHKRHHIFIEPCGDETEELYLQGLSSSLPEDVQLEFIHSIKGLENAEIMRTAYAIEYDCVDPTVLRSTLEFKDIEGLYGAGQFNGSSGYEEAAAQGLIAGINAALKIQGKEPFVLDRASSYIGTLIDDLTNKGCNDPYRMMTSRSEYRLILRQDNADIRLTEFGHKIGLINNERYEKFLDKCEKIRKERERVEKTIISPSKELNDLIVSRETSPIISGVFLADLIRRPQLNYEILKDFDKSRPDFTDDIFEQVEIEIKYEGYINRQLADVKEMRRLEKRIIPDNINYDDVIGLRLEAREKLKKIRPENIGKASRISGVSPSDISVLIIYLNK